MEAIYQQGIPYKKLGVCLTDIMNNAQQLSIFDKEDRVKQEKLLKAVDEIQAKMGFRALTTANQVDSSRYMNRNYMSRCYTTNVDDIIEVK